MISRMRQAGFTLIELLIGMVLAAVAIGASLSILAHAAHIVATSQPNTAFESALISAWHIANDFEFAGQGLLPVQRDWFCYLSSQQQDGTSTYTVLAPFLLLVRPIEAVSMPEGPHMPKAPWMGMYSTLALIEYASYYPIHPAVDVVTPAGAYTVGLRSLGDTGSDAAVGLFTGFVDPAATTRLSSFGRPCFVSEKTGISKTRVEYVYKPQWSAANTLNVRDSVDAVQSATTCANYLGADWMQLRGPMPTTHVHGSWTFGTNLLFPRTHTVISNYVPNFVAWSVTPTGQLLRNNMLVHSNGGLESNIVGAISVEPLRCTSALPMPTCQFVAPPQEGLAQFLRASAYSPSDALLNWTLRTSTAKPAPDIFYRSTGKEAYFAGTIAPMEDYTSVYGMMVSVAARQSQYDDTYLAPDIVRCCLHNDVFTVPSEPTVLTGRGLSPDRTHWRHFHWETAFIMVPMQNLPFFDARRIRTLAGLNDAKKMAL